MENIDGTEIGRRIQERRKSLGLTQGELASKVHIAISTISRYEKGMIENVKLPVLEVIAKSLNVTSTWLMFGGDIEVVEYSEDDFLLLYNKLTEEQRETVKIVMKSLIK